MDSLARGGNIKIVAEVMLIFVFLLYTVITLTNAWESGFFFFYHPCRQLTVFFIKMYKKLPRNFKKTGDKFEITQF